jgi:cytochrome o ubiquinol oxidase subunit 3
MSATLAPHSPARANAQRIVTGYGFWIFLLSDFIMFSALFAAFAVLVHATDGGPGPHELFDLRTVEMETAALLASSFTSGLATIAATRKRMAAFQLAMAATGVLGALFLSLEIHEFVGLVQQGAGPQRSAFLSSFFTLVGCHGLHVALGLLWLTTMMAQAFAKGFRDDILRRLLCFSLFWHALDIIWVGLFTVVYLYGVYL